MKRKNVYSIWRMNALPLPVAMIATITFTAYSEISSAVVSLPNIQVNQFLDGPFSKNKQIEPSLAQNPIPGFHGLFLPGRLC
jgi:hypothetical protein